MSGLAVKGLASLTLAFALVGGCNQVFMPRVTDRQAAIRIDQGRLTDSDVKTGVKRDAWIPGVKYIILPTTLEKTTVSATAEDATTIRAAENSRIFGKFEIHFTIDKKDPNFGKAYTELKVDDIGDITPFINNYVIPAAIDVYQKIPVMDVNKDQPAIGKKIKEKLQGYLNDRGYTYIRILDVIPSGVGLSKEANEMLEQIVKEQRKKQLLDVQGQVAEMSKEITDKQTAVTLEAVSKMTKAGIPVELAVQLYYMQLLHVNDALGKPNVPGPIPGTGIGSLSK